MFWTHCTRVTFCTWQAIMHFINIFFPLLPLLVGVKLILKFSWVIYSTPTQEAKKEREQKRNTYAHFWRASTNKLSKVLFLRGKIPRYEIISGSKFSCTNIFMKNNIVKIKEDKKFLWKRNLVQVVVQEIDVNFRQNDSLMGESFWQNNSLFTHIIFELQPIMILPQSQILGITL